MHRCHAAFIAAFAVLTYHASGQEGPAALRPEEWRADIRYLADSILPRHPNFYRVTPRAQVEREVAALTAGVESSSRDQIIVGLQRIVALARDGHSRLLPGFDARIGFRVLPVAFYWFEDGLHVRAAAPEVSTLAGGRVLRIRSLGADEAMRRVDALVAQESPGARLAEAAWLLEVAEVDAALGISATATDVPIVVLKEGVEVSRTLHPRNGVPVTGLGTPADWIDARTGPAPLGLTRLNETAWVQPLARDSALYVRLSAIANSPNQTFDAFVRQIFATAEAIRATRIVLDVRWNNGGDNTLLKPLITSVIERPRFNRKDAFFVLLGRHTFSAAQNLVTRLENWTNVSLVGEPSGAPPNHYGDAVRYRLPNSGITVLMSSVLWQDALPQDRRRAVQPHVPAPMTFADYRGGRDPALEAALRRNDSPR